MEMYCLIVLGARNLISRWLAELVTSESCEEESILCFALVSDGLLIFFTFLDCRCVTPTSAFMLTWCSPHDIGESKFPIFIRTPVTMHSGPPYSSMTSVNYIYNDCLSK